MARALGELVEHVGAPVILHDCNKPRWDLLEHLKTVAYWIDVTAPTAADLDGIGMLIDRGGVLVAGCIPSTEPARPVRAETIATDLAAITDRIGLNRKVLADNIIVTHVRSRRCLTAVGQDRVVHLCRGRAVAVGRSPPRCESR